MLLHYLSKGIILFSDSEYLLFHSEIAALKALHHSLKNRREADNVKIVIWFGNGWTPQEVAELLFITEAAVRARFEK